jgi:hypothetical protein
MALRKCVERLNASGRPSQLGVVRIGAESRVVQRGENIHSPDLAPTKDVTEGKRPILRLSRWQLNLFLRAKPQRMSKEITGWIEACQEKYLDPGAGPDRQTQWREAPLPHVPLRLAPEAGEPLGRWLLTQFGAVDAQRQAEIPGMGADLSVRLPGNLLLRVECARREGEDNRLVFFGPKNLLAREMILVMEDGREIRVDVRPERILTWAPPETPQHGPQQT